MIMRGRGVKNAKNWDYVICKWSLKASKKEETITASHAWGVGMSLPRVRRPGNLSGWTSTAGSRISRGSPEPGRRCLDLWHDSGVIFKEIGRVVMTNAKPGLMSPAEVKVRIIYYWDKMKLQCTYSRFGKLFSQVPLACFGTWQYGTR